MKIKVLEADKAHNLRKGYFACEKESKVSRHFISGHLFLKRDATTYDNTKKTSLRYQSSIKSVQFH